MVEFELFQAWETFKLKNKNSTYVIFKSSILFERGWGSKFNKIISVFAPKDERVSRCRLDSNMRGDYIWSLLNSEMSDLFKNSKSHYIIHNYDTGPDLIDQINLIDEKLVNYYLECLDKNRQKNKFY